MRYLHCVEEAARLASQQHSLTFLYSALLGLADRSVTERLSKASAWETATNYFHPCGGAAGASIGKRLAVRQTVTNDCLCSYLLGWQGRIIGRPGMTMTLHRRSSMVALLLGPCCDLIRCMGVHEAA